ncbi:MAG: pyridoxamine 5'-phosphate oxidase family protein [Treponema sp.]|jgi:nitroimidazol reductase NimA-like FMN-containing flavoprotein (pyridoxamine 5'-phosphate oxidase superfamily)|nr:pyridoxamine 5'-phosphate oxidase family protein [Treponema sp.]
MRRSDREVTDIEEKLGIIRRCKVLRLGLAEQNQPYIVPMNFGFDYKDGLLTLYLHGAKEGKKRDILSRNRQVCFEMDGGHSLITGKNPGDYSFAYESIIGFGVGEILEKDDEKTHGLNALMKHQTGEDREYTYPEEQLRGVDVFRIRVNSFTGKRRASPRSSC